jgi:hypothetical protein
MLIEVKRHGMSFWEAPHRIGPAFQDPSPRQSRGNKILAAYFRNELQLQDANGKAADLITGDLNDPKEWGDLVQFADELDPEADAAASEAETQLMIADIQKRVRAAFGVTWRGFMRVDRKKENWARTASMALCRQRIQGITMDQIGQAHGWKTHVAVVKALTRFETLRQTSSKFAATLGRVQEELLMKGGMDTRNMMN